MSDEAIMALVGIAQHGYGGQLPGHDRPRADGRVPDWAPNQAGIGTDPQGTFEARSRSGLNTAFQYDGAVARVEYHAGLDCRFLDRDPRGIADHDAAVRDLVGLSRSDQLDRVLAQQAFQRRDQVVHAVQQHALDLDGARVRDRSSPGGALGHRPPHGDPVVDEARGRIGEGRRQSPRRERGRADHRWSGNGTARLDGRHAGLGEAGQMREREDRRRFVADEGFLALADQVRTRAELGDRADAGERRPGGAAVGIEEIQRVRHSRCTRSFSLFGWPVGITSVWPLARTTTMSCTPTTAMRSPSDHTTESRTSSPRVTLPTVTLPFSSRRRMRSSASHDPMSSQGKVPVTTASRLVRSRTATSTATGVTAPKNRGASPALSADHPAASSSAYAPASPRKRAAPQANIPEFQRAPRRRSNAARAALGFSTNRFTRRALPNGSPGTM